MQIRRVGRLSSRVLTSSPVLLLVYFFVRIRREFSWFWVSNVESILCVHILAPPKYDNVQIVDKNPKVGKITIKK